MGIDRIEEESISAMSSYFIRRPLAGSVEEGSELNQSKRHVSKISHSEAEIPLIG